MLVGLIIMVLFLTNAVDFNGAGNEPASKKKLKSQKKKKRKLCEEEEEEEKERVAVEDVCSDADACRATSSDPEHRQQRPQTEQTGSGTITSNNTICMLWKDTFDNLC